MMEKPLFIEQQILIVKKQPNFLFHMALILMKKKNKKGETPLHFAAFNKNKKTVELLISHGINIIEKNNNGETALHIAIWRQNILTAELLKSYGAEN
ncbi:hypothetical protein TVAG_527750 [Trichomonas vaginalis G3]|uniref:Uncharacterized protein n=1 Tax=Trichomonas vaginalis (strain ATCC PRA-98 / G3) TaxID=412133 RepID=A2GKD1_TRIV3|nr:cyclin-dependent kinase inhibitor 2C-related family [Trichomonas vaginalis G3]EAX82386.1 hypothetical protein TVAG_527750 [Trichomonas vaginalis G3]KAI5533973.1 cyclin-dependent kinase inhibitor 2C-related family [Trichomonas vaginalis G3]|eukprot:XP_001295316.1 hypothetical protein [Trichomonas vaginalis G3]